MMMMMMNCYLSTIKTTRLKTFHFPFIINVIGKN